MGSFAMMGGGVGAGDPNRNNGYGGTRRPPLPGFPSLGGAGGGFPTSVDSVPTYVGSTPPPGSGASGGGGGFTPGVPAAAPTTNTATPDPNLQSMVDAYKNRLKGLQDRPALDPTYTARATAAARGEIMDTAAGAEEAARQRSVASGRAGGGALAGSTSRIGEAARRASNKAAVDISLARTRDEENNALQRDAMENSFTLGGAGIMGAPSQLGLQQQGLGLQQQLGMGNLALGQAGLGLQRDQFNAGRDDNRLANLMGLMRTYGYAGY